MAGESILIVDDNAANLKLARVLLRGEGYDVRTASDAEEALQILETSRPRLILMDIQLPGMDGLELTRRLKAGPATKDIIIIALTAYAMTGDSEKARAAGCDGYVAKPIDTDALPLLIADYLAGTGDRPVIPILVVDDNESTRKMLRLALQAEGYLVLEAGDGASALATVAIKRPALILQDLRLPDIEGVELAKRLRALLPEVPIVAVTASEISVAESRTSASVLNEVLIKPVAPSKIVELVRRLLEPKKSPHPLGKTVLLVEDDPAQRKLAQLELSAAGFEVVSATGGESALGLALERRPDAILSDVLMPEMDGFQLCRAIRRDPRLAAIPVLLMSANYLEPEDRGLAMRVGASGYVARSESFEQIVRMLIDVIDRPASHFGTTWSEEDLTNEHLRRLGSQLQRKTVLEASLSRRSSLQATALSVLSSVSDALARQLDPESALGNTLAHCLDAAGLSVGAIFLRDEDGRLSLREQIGMKGVADFWGHLDLLDLALEGVSVALPSRERTEAEEAFLVAARIGSALLVPIVAREEALGVLFLASSRPDLVASDGDSFTRAARSVATQLGQALALSRMFATLAAAEQRYRTLLESARDGISVLTPEGVVLEANRALTELLGLPLDLVVGHHIREFVPPEGKEQQVASYQRLAKEPLSVTQPVPIRRPDGSTIHVEFSLSPVTIGGESLVLSLGREVTERLRLEEQFRQAQKMEAVGRLAGGVAHDFNNLLSVILTYSDLLLAAPNVGEPLGEYLKEIRHAGKRAADLTRQLLAFSRRQVVEPKVVDLNETLANLDKMLHRILGEDVDLVTLLAPELGPVKVDPGNIEQVIMNLVVNARDAMPRGGKLTIETANVLLEEEYTREHLNMRPGPHVLLSVSDTGIGMDKETQVRIFEPFFTTKGQGKGTGLGLSTVFGIVEQSGGSVWVYSEPGKGTTFKVYLPRWDGAAEERPAEAAATSFRGSETILLAEDEDQVRAAALRILRGQGYQVIEARSANEALLLSRGHVGPIHLLLTDVVMPEISGPELALRLAKERPGTRVLYMSGYTDDSIVRHGVLDPGVAFVQKPLTPNTLNRSVRDVLDAALPAGGRADETQALR